MSQKVQRAGLLVAHTDDQPHQVVQRAGLLVAYWENPTPVEHTHLDVAAGLSGTTTLATTLNTNNDVTANISGATTVIGTLSMGTDVAADLSGSSSFTATLDVDAPLEPSALSGSSTLSATLSSGFEVDLTGQTTMASGLTLVVADTGTADISVTAGTASTQRSWDSGTALIVSAWPRKRNTSF